MFSFVYIKGQREKEGIVIFLEIFYWLLNKNIYERERPLNWEVTLKRANDSHNYQPEGTLNQNMIIRIILILMQVTVQSLGIKILETLLLMYGSLRIPFGFPLISRLMTHG